MVVTIKKDGMRFGCRAGAIIYNEDKTKVLMEKQKENRYRFPGGRIDVHEDSETTIHRELKEELNLKADLQLKYMVEMFLNSSNIKYHEVGFYYITQIKEKCISNNFKSLDGDSTFEWLAITDLNKYKVVERPIQEKVVNNKITSNKWERIVYREY